MELSTLTEFLKWCTILNGALLVWVSLWVMAAPDQMYRWQSIWLKLPREQYDPVMFQLVGLFKILFLVFNLFPLLALTIMN